MTRGSHDFHLWRHYLSALTSSHHWIFYFSVYKKGGIKNVCWIHSAWCALEELRKEERESNLQSGAWTHYTRPWLQSSLGRHARLDPCCDRQCSLAINQQAEKLKGQWVANGTICLTVRDWISLCWGSQCLIHHCVAAFQILFSLHTSIWKNIGIWCDGAILALCCDMFVPSFHAVLCFVCLFVRAHVRCNIDTNKII